MVRYHSQFPAGRLYDRAEEAAAEAPIAPNSGRLAKIKIDIAAD